MMARSFFLLTTAACVATASFFVACSNKNPIDADGGTDATADDTGMVQKDSGGGNDAGTMKMKCPTYPVKGACDMVAQDCPLGQECVSNMMMNGDYVTACEAERTGSSPKGGTCANSSECVPGTACQMGRCSPFCCEGDDSVCGMSPDNKPGICNLILVNMANKEVGRVCTYSDTCKPFKIAPCSPGSACLVQDMSGLAKCTQINPMPGKDEGQPCSYANECKDGMYCIGGADAGACTWACYLGNGPFDAGIKTAPAGSGGCPNGKSCKVMISGFPNWMGGCAP